MKVKLADYFYTEGIQGQHIADVVKDLGEEGLLQELNNNLDRPNYSIAFNFNNVEATLVEGRYNAILLAYHWIAIKKPMRKNDVKELVENIKKVLDVQSVIYTDTNILIEFYAGEAPYANTIAEARYNINKVLGPYLEEKLSTLNLFNYKVHFMIKLF